MNEKPHNPQSEINIPNPGHNTDNQRNEVMDVENQLVDGKRNITHGTSDWGAFLHIVKGSLGSGILAMPFAFKHAGSLMGLIGCCMAGILITHAIVILVGCSQSLCAIFNKEYLSYSETAEYAFIQGCKGGLQCYAGSVRRLVNFFLFVTYYGVNICYVLLIAETFKQVIEEYSKILLDIRVYTLLVLLLVFPVGIIRLMKFLVPFSTIANFCLMVALCLVFREIFTDLPRLSSRPMVQPAVKWPIFISTVLLSLEGIGTIMPVENEMKYPRRLTHSPGLLYIAMVIIILLNVTVGFFGYVKYGDGSRASVSLNLPNDWLSECIKLTIALSLLLTYGLQLTVSVKVVWDSTSCYFKAPTSRLYYAVRGLLILGTGIVASIVPSLSGVISLLGAIGFSILGIFLPAMIELVFLSNNIGCWHWRFIKNILLMIFAVFCAVAGTYCSIIDLVGKAHLH